MGYSRGYHSYRGRRSKGKIALAVLLVLVILAAIAVMLLSRQIVYDETGTPHLELPWQEEPAAETPPEEPELDLTIQEPEQPEALRAFAVKEQPLTQAIWGEA